MTPAAWITPLIVAECGRAPRRPPAASCSATVTSAGDGQRPRRPALSSSRILADRAADRVGGFVLREPVVPIVARAAAACGRPARSVARYSRASHVAISPPMPPRPPVIR